MHENVSSSPTQRSLRSRKKLALGSKVLSPLLRSFVKEDLSEYSRRSVRIPVPTKTEILIAFLSDGDTCIGAAERLRGEQGEAKSRVRYSVVSPIQPDNFTVAAAG